MLPNPSRKSVLLSIALVAVLVSGVAWADEADDRYAVAAGHYARGRWKLAVEEFQGYLKKYPNHANAEVGRFFLAESLLQLGHMGEAGDEFRDYLKRQPTGRFARAALFRAAETAYLTDKTGQAKTELEAFRKKYPKDKLNAYVLPYLGDLALAEKNTTQAADYFRQGLTEFAESPLQDDCRFGLAQALEKDGKSEEAARLYLAVAAKTAGPLADEAQFRLGALQYSTGKYAEAVDTLGAFEKRLADSPWQPSARLCRGWALMKLGRLDEAKTLFQTVASDPKVGIEAQYWLGLAQKAEKDWPTAAKTLLAVAQVNPKHKLVPAIRFQAGDALLRAGDPAAASEQFDQVIASAEPDNEWIDDAMRGKVQAALRSKDYRALEQHIAAFVKRFPDSLMKADLRRILGRSLLERKQYERAERILDPLLSDQQHDLNPEDRYLMSLAYEGLKRYDDALAVLLPALDSATGPLKADVQLAQGSLLVATERYAEAVRPLEAVLAGKPTGEAAVKCKAELAICYARTKRLDDAKRLFAELLEKHPKHELIAPTAEQLAEAAYDAGDRKWSAGLFAWLAGGGGQGQYTAKGLSGLAWSQFKTGKLDEAAATFDQLLKKNPDASLAAEAALARGRILQQLKKPDAALAMYDLVIEKYPKSPQHPEALLAAARVRDELQQNQQSANLYEQLVKAYPKLPELDAVLYEWAWVLDELGKLDESNNVLTRLSKEFPKSDYWAESTYRLAQSALDAKDYAQAGKLLADVLGDKPLASVREHVLFLKGQLAVAEKKWKEVGPPFKLLIKDYPESPLRRVAEYWIADAVYRQDDYQAAGKLFDQLAKQTTDHNEPWQAMVGLRRAQVLWHEKKWTEALAVASKIESEYPDFEQQYEADFVIGRCLASQADFAAARQIYQRVVQSPHGSKTETAAMAQWMIGESYFHQKNYEAALREFLRLEILYAFPIWQAGALLQAGKCHELLGEWKEAAELYARLLKVYPKSSFAEEAGHRLRLVKQRTGGNAVEKTDPA